MLNVLFSRAGVSALSLILGLAIQPAQAQNPQDATKPQPTGQKPALSVKLFEARLQALESRVLATGTVAAWQELSVGTETSGLRVAEVLAEVGHYVKKGQVLARFEQDTIAADLAMAQAGVAEAQAAADEARANADMVRPLQGTGALSQQQLIQTFSAEKTALARLQSAQAALAQQQVRLRNTRLLAPEEGLITSRHITVGKIASPGEEFFKLVRQGRLEWRAELNETDLLHIKPGQKVLLDLASGPVVGKVRVVSPALDLQSRMAIVYVDLPKGSSSLKSGSFLKGWIQHGESKSVTVPQTALMERDGFSYVYTVQESTSRAQRVKVQVGTRQGDWAEIKAGLKAGELVIQSGVAFLADGDLVKVLK